jgi:hypothetical protein
MKTGLRHTNRVGPQILVARRRSKSANDVNLGVRAANGSGSIRDNIENPRVVMMHFSGAVVAEEVVELGQSFGNIGIAMAIDDIQMLACMSVEEPQMAFLHGWGSTGCRNKGKNGKQGNNENPQNLYL